jgi:hypothetical protein
LKWNKVKIQKFAGWVSQALSKAIFKQVTTTTYNGQDKKILLTVLLHIFYNYIWHYIRVNKFLISTLESINNKGRKLRLNVWTFLVFWFDRKLRSVFSRIHIWQMFLWGPQKSIVKLFEKCFAFSKKHTLFFHVWSLVFYL